FCHESGEPRDISTWARQAIDYPSRNWIRVNQHDNVNRLSRLLGRADRWESWGDQDIDLELHEFGHKAWDTVHLSLSVAILNQDVFPLNITEISETLAECVDERIGSGGVAPSRQISYPRDFLWLLRLGYTCSSKQHHHKQD